MTKKYSDEQLKKARERAESKAGFFVHFLIYLFVNAVLAIVNMLSDTGELWFMWITLMWGIGIGIHFLSVFVFNSFLENYTEAEIKKELERMD